MVFNFCAALYIAGMLWRGTNVFTWTTLGLSLLVSVVIGAAGSFTLWSFGAENIKARLPVEFVVGFVTLTVPIMGLCYLFNVPILLAFAIWGFCLLLLGTFALTRSRPQLENHWFDVGFFIPFALVTGLLVRIPVESAQALLRDGVLPIWNDYYIHGLTIASFGSPFSMGTDMELMGVGRVFYHYAPYMIPAVFQSVLGLSGLAMATGLLLPLGLVIAGLGSYALAVELGDRRSAVIALTILTCLPLSSTIVHSGYFNFDWLLLIAPGTGYAIGVAAVAVLMTGLYLREMQTSLLMLDVVLLGALIVIRVQMFLLLAPAIGATVLMVRYSGLRKVFAAATLLGLAALMFGGFSQSIYGRWKEFTQAPTYLHYAMDMSSFLGRPIHIPEYPFLTALTQIVLIVVAVLGPLVLLYPAALRLKVLRSGFRDFDVFPLLLTLTFIALMLLMPVARNADISEYKHRQFPLFYVIVVIFTVDYLRFLWRAEWLQRAVIPLALSVCLIMICWNWNSDPAQPDLTTLKWASALSRQKIGPGVVESAHYLEAHSLRGDVFAMSSSLVGTTLLDNSAIEIVALSGVPAFMARPNLLMNRSPCLKELTDSRRQLLSLLSESQGWESVRALLTQNGVRWLLVPTDTSQKWDPQHSQAVFTSAGVTVYDAGHVGVPFASPHC